MRKIAKPSVGARHSMETETYADGLKRVLQVKKSATADGKDCMVSSGAAVYDEAGRVIMQGEPYKTRAGNYDDTMVNATKIEYDVRGRQTRVENPDGTTVKYAYSASGNKRITSVTDPRGKVRTSYSDRKGNIERIEEPDGQTTSYTYDGMGQILTVTDSKGNVTTCKYDKQGRRLETENPDTGKISYTYDGAGNLIAKTTPNTDKKGYAINYVYDNSRLIAVTSREGEPVKYTYGKSNDDMNGAGRLVKTESGNCVDEYGYDWMGNVIRHKRTIKGLDGKKTEYNASYSYDYFGRMKTMKLPDGEIITYGYNKGGQLSGVGSSKGKPYVSGIKYNVTGQRTQINYGNGTGTSYEYDERNHRLKRLETRNAKSILQTIEYEYDDTGNVTERESEMLGTDGRMKRAIHEYEYDSSGRLTEGSGKVEKTTAGILRPNIVSYKSKYSYDAIGNILTKTQAVNGGESSLSCNDTYTYGGKQPHAVTKAGAMVFTYDDNGNMIKRENTETKNTMTLVWDDENRLIKTTDSLHTTDYRYDANGERIIKKSELGETQYVSANYIVRNKTVISKHIFAGNQRVASTVSMKDNCGTVSEKNTMYFHPDHLGSSSYVTDKKGNFFEMIEYLPYGETLYDEAATVDKTEFRFTGKEMDAETGLYYYGARYYDARTSRWISPDPILESYLSGKPAGGVYNPGNINLYGFCLNSPVQYVDPDGERALTADELSFLKGRLGESYNGNKIDYSYINIDDEYTDYDNRAWSPITGNMDVYSPTLLKSYNSSILVHETFHQFQYMKFHNSLGFLSRLSVGLRLGWEQIKYMVFGINVYAYAQETTKTTFSGKTYTDNGQDMFLSGGTSIKTLDDIDNYEAQAQFYEDFSYELSEADKALNDGKIGDEKIHRANAKKYGEVLFNSGIDTADVKFATGR
ncbi:MAG TPA: RHS repeat-associated core domain-containing protein [Spirochaetota bacterium]|nr:RHS repeat-associated core domain-containing protein [Spirochaetota bacterium]